MSSASSFVLGLAVLFLANIMWGITQHHNQGLVVDTIKDIVNTPPCFACYLPHKTERAMGTFVFAR